jgi:hypothetical protein
MKIREAVCDPEAFQALKALVEGPLESRDTLASLERVVRGVVLHDEMRIELSVHRFVDRPGPFFAAPVVTGYESIIKDPPRHFTPPRPDVYLSPKLLELARRISRSAGDPEGFFKNHVEILKGMLQVCEDGGSAVCEGSIWKAIDEEHTSFPKELFSKLDAEWAEFARSADAGDIGPQIPPVLSIVMSRAARRDKLCAILADLRDEWAEPRAKVWAIVDRMKGAQDLRQLNDLRRQLADAGGYFSPAPSSSDARPLRILWNVLLESGTGAAVAFISGGIPSMGAAVGGVRAIAAVAPKALPDSPDALLRRGAYDLAARVRRATASVEPTPALVAKFLTSSEKEKLGL